MPSLNGNDISLQIKTTANTQGAEATVKSIQKLSDQQNQARQSSDNFSKALKFSSIAAVAVGGAVVAAGQFAIKSAADYEQSLNIFKSVSGATAAQMQLVGAQARALGKDVSLPGISAADAAQAMTELAKAGLSVNDTMAASKGVLALAKAGQLDTATAAEIAANALLAFGLQGKEATRVADLLAAAANASSSDVHDMGLSLSQVSALAAQTKRPIQDVVTQIALLANNGIKGSDAGTSLKTMLLALTAPSSTASKAIKRLGVDVYDAEGKMRSTRDILGQFTKATSKMTDAQKNASLAQIFGSDAVRAASILIRGGTDAYDKMTKSVTKNGAALDLAAAQNAGFNGAIDALQSSLETVAIDVGMKLLPPLTSLAKVLANDVDPAFTKLKGVAKETIGVIGPSVSALGGTIRNDLLPALKQAATSDFVKYIGGTFVIAIDAAIIALNFGTQAIASFIGQGSQMTSLLVMLGTALVAYQVIVAATTIKTNLMTAAQSALNFAMKLNPMALVAAAALGIVAAYVQVVTTSDRTTVATDQLKAARDRLTQATNAAKAAEDNLRGAQLSAEGAALAVEQAQQRYNQTVAQYGPKSFAARQAAYDLKVAQQQLRDATDQVRSKTEALKTAEANRNKATGDVIRANEAVKNSALRAAGGYQQLTQAINDAVKADAKTGVAGTGKNTTNAIFGINNKHATGATRSSGGRTLVGESGPEIVNLPRGSSVMTNHEVNKMAPGKTENHFHGNIILQGADSVRAFFDELDQDTLLSSHNMTANRGGF